MARYTTAQVYANAPHDLDFESPEGKAAAFLLESLRDYAQLSEDLDRAIQRGIADLEQAREYLDAELRTNSLGILQSTGREIDLLSHDRSLATDRCARAAALARAICGEAIANGMLEGSPWSAR